MNEHPSAQSQISRARAAGFFWLITFITGFLAMFIGGRFVVNSDAAVTAANVLGNQVAFRLGMAGMLVSTISYLVATVLVYELLKPVNRTFSLSAALFSLLGCGVGALVTVLNFASLALLKGSPFLGVFPAEQLQALALASFNLGLRANDVGLVFFGLHIGLVGYLFITSRMAPRIVGALLMIGGFAYELHSFGSFLGVPTFFPLILLPGFFAEFVLTVWLLAKGVNARAATRANNGPPAAQLAPSLS